MLNVHRSGTKNSKYVLNRIEFDVKTVTCSDSF